MFSFLLELIEFVLFCLLWAMRCTLSSREESTAASLLHGSKKSGEVKGETTNWGQMVSSAGLSAALQSRRPAEFDEQNIVRLLPHLLHPPNGKIWVILVL